MIKVKVCGMKDPLNVEEVGESGPDFIGFIFYPGSLRYVGVDPELSLFKNVPVGIKRVGVFYNEAAQKIASLSIRYGLDMVQLHGNESAVTCLQLMSSGLTIIKAFNVGEDFRFELLNQYVPACDYFLFDTKSDKPGGSSKKFSWDKLEEYKIDKPFFLSGGIGPEDIDLLKALNDRRLYAVDVNSRFESSPGIKDPMSLRQFINSIKEERQ